MLPNFTHNSNPNCPPNIINRNRCLTQPELDKFLHRIQMDYERHSKPLKAKTPDPPSKVTNVEQVTRRLVDLPTQAAYRVFNHHPAPYQINPSCNPIFQYPPGQEYSRRQGFTPSQPTVNRRGLPITNPPYLAIS